MIRFNGRKSPPTSSWEFVGGKPSQPRSRLRRSSPAPHSPPRGALSISPPPRDVPVRVGRRGPSSPLAKKRARRARTSPVGVARDRRNMRRADASTADVGLLVARARGRGADAVVPHARADVRGGVSAQAPHEWGRPSQEAYFAEEDERRRASPALRAVVRDPTRGPGARHDRGCAARDHARSRASPHATYAGRWLAADHCVCARLALRGHCPAPRRRVRPPHRVRPRLVHRSPRARVSRRRRPRRRPPRPRGDFARLCERNEGRVAVLWPRDAVDVREFVRNAAANERECARGGEEAIGSDRAARVRARRGARDVGQLCAGPRAEGRVRLRRRRRDVARARRCSRGSLRHRARARPPAAFRSPRAAAFVFAVSSAPARRRQHRDVVRRARAAEPGARGRRPQLSNQLGHAESACARAPGVSITRS